MFIESLYSGHGKPFEGVVSKEESQQVSCRIREQLADVLGVNRIPSKKAAGIFTVKTVKRRGYTVETVNAEICDNLTMLCYVLVPDNPNGDGVVALCGHGYGCRQIIRQSKSGGYRSINFLDNYQKNFAEALAREGHIVICPEFVGFGEARLEKDLKKPFYISSCEAVSDRFLLYGLTTAGIRVFQAMKCVDILKDKYNCSDIGCMGISGGGLVALYSSVLDERIKRICICGYVNSFKDSVMSMWHCPDNYIPGILRIGEMSDFASSLSPRKLMMQFGTKDKLFPVEASRTAAKSIASIFKMNGAEESFIPFEFNGKHEVSLKKALEFFSGR